MGDPRYGDGSYLSNSEVQCYLRCGLSYEFNLQERRHITIPMAVGTGVAAAAGADNQTKLDIDRGLNPKELCEIASQVYLDEVNNHECPGTRAEIGRGEDSVVQATQAFWRDVSPMITSVLLAESPAAVTIAGVRFAGTPDYVTQDGVGDLKTGRAWTDERVHTSRQLTAYGYLHKALLGDYPQRVWIDSVSPSRRGWVGRRIYSHRRPADYMAFMDILKHAKAGIDAGIFLPAPEGAWWCSAKWCPWHHMCPAVIGRKR